MPQPVFRFAPSPNGRLHLGHAYSALLNEKMAREQAGRFLLRIEDIDRLRCTAQNIAAAIDDLRWLGLQFEEPALLQSRRMSAYREAIAVLMEQGLLYVCTCTHKEISAAASTARDPEGQPLYPGTCRGKAHMFEKTAALRLRMDEAMRRIDETITWQEKGRTVAATPADWGDVIIARKDIGTSYHLAVVIDDAFQGVTDVVRGEDLYQATSIQRLLQMLLGLPEPRYHHHGLVRHDSGRKLAKSRGDQSLADARAAGTTPDTIRSLLGF